MERMKMLVVAGAALTTMACGPGSIKDVVGQPDTPAIPGKVACKPGDITKKLSPLIIDWPSTLRADLETVMAEQSVAVVKFSCDGVEVLTDCQVPGRYGFRGVSPKEENTLIEGGDDISANFGGVQFGANVDFSQSAKLDLATVMVGRRATPRKVLTRGELGEYCDGATHFVRRADIGAFAMSTGSDIRAGAALEVFGQGVSGSSKSTEAKSNKDGDPGACKSADRKATDAPSGCGALIRLSLSPIQDGDVSLAKSEKGTVDDGIGCPEGFVFAEHQCVKKAKAAEAKYFLCDEGDEATCIAQCKAGSHGSCDRFASIFYAENEDKDPSDMDLSQVEALDEQLHLACNEDFGNACAVAGVHAMFRGIQSVPQDAELTELPEAVKKGLRDGVDLFERACIAGHKKACDDLKELYLDEHGTEFARMVFGDADLKKEYTDLLARGCDGGSAGACTELFDLAFKGTLENVPPKAMVMAGENACIGGYAEACMLTALLLQPDTATCKATFAAEPELASVCSDEMSRYPSDVAKAKYLLKRSCSLNEEFGASAICK